MVLPNKRLVKGLQSYVRKGFFVDRAVIITRTAGSADDYGHPIYPETETEVSCSFTDKPSKEDWADYADIENIEAELRCEGIKPNKGDKVTLTDRFNNSGYTSETFEIVGIKDRSVFGYVVALKKVRL